MSVLYGIVFAAILALGAWFLGGLLPVVGAPVFGILIGLIAAETIRSAGSTRTAEGKRETGGKGSALLDPGLKFASKAVLQGAIVLLGFEMNLFRVFDAGRESLLVMCCTLAAAFLSAVVVSRLLRLSGKVPVLIGVGTAICGGSAIAATAPVIGADDDEVARSISTIFLFNVIAVFVFPPLGRLLGLSQTGFGLWAGTAVNDTSSVVAAAYSFGVDAGYYATVVKLTRTLFIIPTVLFLAVFQARRNAADGARVRFSRIFPWFILGFLAASILRTVGAVGPSNARALGVGGRFLITVAMTAIGLRTDFRKLLASGWKPLLLGLLCWISVAGVSLLAQYASGRW